MAEDYPQMARELSASIRTMRQGIPDTMKGFSELAKAALGRRALRAVKHAG